MTPEKSSISPEKAIAVLKRSGANVTLKEAEEILALLYQLASIAVAQHLKKQPSRTNL